MRKHVLATFTEYEVTVQGAEAIGKVLGAGVLLLLLSGCGVRNYQLLVKGRGDLLISPIRKEEPVSSRQAHRRVYGRYVQKGYIDLRPGMHIRVVAPTVPAGESLSTKVVSDDRATRTLTVESNATGWEKAYYVVERRAKDDGVYLRFVAGESMIEGQSRTLRAPELARVDVPEGFSMLRLVFHQRVSANDRDQGLIAASSPAALGEALVNLEQSCDVRRDDHRDGDFACIVISRGVSINAEVGVNANGKMYYLPLGTTLRGLLRKAGGVPAGAVPPKLKVRRRFRNRLISIRYDRAAIRGLVLIDGDRLEW